MADEGIREWRKQRLQALSAKLGGNAALGRKLGYKDGAFVGQMISGRRPITEKTVEAAEAIRDEALGHQGARGWFAREQPSQAVPAPPPQPDLDADLIALVADLTALRELAPTVYSRLADRIHQDAEIAREAAHRQAERAPRKTAVAAARKGGSRQTASVTWGDGNSRQGALPLTTVPDPFSAAPGERESALYRRIEKAPKAADAPRHRKARP